ncbi:MAG: precorrin-8X methylmutase [Deltaproteobacteria bacterium]|jgi:precorrin-8X/cobalt-precorrin-8 methylmutase|nr:precorrin-8X methylmutase [Deltaproteobacteria bacterium]
MEQLDWKLGPSDIESRSFAIIDSEAGSHNWDPQSWTVVRRLIHTSADFDYARDLVISPGAVESGVKAIREGAVVLTDTKMALSGINLKRLGGFPNRLVCLIDNLATKAEAEKTGLTRAMAAVDLALTGEVGAQGAIWVFGNAPTALLRLLERLGADPGLAVPRLVVGLPVGFVNALESKRALAASSLPYFITNLSRKGGSNVAAAAINALAALAKAESWKS